MSKSLTPFSKAQLIPQEETLEVFKHKSDLFIGIPKETAFQEIFERLTQDIFNASLANW